MTGFKVPCPYLYDAGALIAADDDFTMWAVHRSAGDEGRDMLIPSAVLAQAWRDPRRQARLSRFVNECEKIPIGVEIAKQAGVLCRLAGTRDVVDAMVVTIALLRNAMVFTSDPDDIQQLAAASGAKPGLAIRRV